MTTTSHSKAGIHAKNTSVIGDNAIRSFVKRLRDHNSLFVNIDSGLQHAICEKFPKERALRNAWIEWNVRRCASDVERLMMQVNDGWWDGETGESSKVGTLETVFKNQMDALDDILYRHARAHGQDMKMAQGPSPSQLSMDYFRVLHGPDENSLAPNGRPINEYGKKGDPVPRYVTTTIDEDSDAISRLLINRLMNPFHNHVWKHVLRFVNCFSTSKRKSKTNDGGELAVGKQHISGLAKAIACMLSNACLAAAVGTIYSVDSIRTRLVLVSIFSVSFSLPAVLLGTKATRTWMLSVAYFQVMIIFVGTTSEAMRRV